LFEDRHGQRFCGPAATIACSGFDEHLYLEAVCFSVAYPGVQDPVEVPEFNDVEVNVLDASETKSVHLFGAN
jgi:hypothetical protein